ncbi:MAG: hypothetical protein NZM31_02740, partial [Gemmatales bacterium]|nr:hypothetical protein [Gemmatales bacterium]MDW8385917.1 hypothetical protein [Gemmatales bacterium]
MNRWPGLLAVVLVCLSLFGVSSCAPTDSPSGSKAVDTDKAGEPIPSPPTPRMDQVKDRIEAAIEQARRRELLTTNGFWTVFHGILGMGPSLTLTNPDTGEKVNALDYICSGGELRGLRFLPTRWGLDVQMGPPFVGQGHQDQFIAEMA